jgi:hypothetical protein
MKDNGAEKGKGLGGAILCNMAQWMGAFNGAISAWIADYAESIVTRTPIAK